jgi:hypothetical protein
MKTSQRRRFGQRRSDEAAAAAGAALVFIALSAGGVYLVGARTSTHPETDTPAAARAEADQRALPLRVPQRLSEMSPSERYFNSYLGDRGAALGSSPTERNIGIRPDMDERRQGYVIFDLGGGFRTLSTTVGVSDGSPAGTSLLMEILGDGRVLMSQVVEKGADVSLSGLDVSGVSELKFAVSNPRPSRTGAAGDGPEGVFADPLLR